MRCPIRTVALLGALTTALGSTALVGTAYAAVPSNDTFGSATAISSLPFSDTLDTTEATTDDDDHAAGSACGAPSGPPEVHSVWYDYTASSDGTIRIDTSGSDYQVGVAVLTGSPSGFSSVACFLGSSSVQVVAGQTYHILVVDFGAGTGGTLRLSVSELTLPEAHVTIDRFGSFDQRTGVATVTGTLTCTGNGGGGVYTSLVQPVGRIATISGYGFADGAACDGSPHPWSTQIEPYSGGKFAGGHATASVSAFVCNESGCASDDAQQQVTLRR
jgi:hypothetical protein